MDLKNLRSFDLETHLIRPGVLAPKPVLGSWADSKAAWLIEYERLPDILLGMPGVIAGASIAYDLAIMGAEWPALLPYVFELYEQERVFDVLIAQTLDAIAKGYMVNEPRRMIIDPRTGAQIRDSKGHLAERYSLDIVTDLNLGRKAKENDEYRLRYGEFDGLPFWQLPAKAAQYPLDDARNTWDVAEKQLATLENLHEQSAQAYTDFCAHLGAIWGIRSDPQALASLREKNRKDIEEQIAKLMPTGLLNPDGSKCQKAIRRRIVEVCGENTPRTKTDAVQMTREVLEESGDPDLQAVADLVAAQKVGSTYLDKLEEGVDKPINVRCNILLATGRVSYSGIVQLLPREGGIREAIIPPEGFYFCSVDYSGVELVTWAQVCLELLGRSSLADALNAGLDAHAALAAQMAGESYDTFLPKTKVKGSREAKLRQAAKAGNFGFPGGMGVPKFVFSKRKEGINFCVPMGRAEKCGERKVKEWRGRKFEAPECLACLDAAADIRDAWFIRWDEARPYFNEVQRLLVANDNRITQLVSKRVRGGVSFTQAANSFFQGLASDGAKLAVRRLTRSAYLDRESPMFGSRLALFTHDETVFALSVDKAHEAGHEQARVMVDSMRKYTPDVAVKAEPALMRRLSKNAETKYVNERLVPWEDA